LGEYKKQLGRIQETLWEITRRGWRGEKMKKKVVETSWENTRNALGEYQKWLGNRG